MHLVSPLSAGIAGAENGTAEIYSRGTTLRAVYWLDFEGSLGVGSGADIALDSHGGAVAYVNELCLIVVKTAGGATLRSFVAGVAAPAVEVVSNSFEGVRYDGADSGPGYPTTLAVVLDRWVTTNGGTDWKVALPGGGTGAISAAIAGSYGLVFNVKSYGAIGDGVAFDTVAINAAIAAAQAVNGGIVYLPPGTYRTAGGHTGAVPLIGASSTATVIVLDNLAGLRIFQTAALTTGYQVIANMRLTAANSTPGAQVLRIVGGSRLVLQNLDLDGANFAGDICNTTGGSGSTVDVLCSACTFRLSSSGRAWFASSTGTVKRGVFRDCRFITPATFTPTGVVFGRGLWFYACLFENDATTTGTYACIESSHSSGYLHINGCEFTNATGATVTAMLFGAYSNSAYYDEVDNLFDTTITAYSYTATAGARGANVRLRSRENRSILITDNTAAPALPLDQYGLVVLSSTNTAIVFSAAKQPPDGARGTIVINRPNSGAGGTATAGTNFLNPAAAPTVANGCYTWEYRACTPNATTRLTLLTDGRNNGVAA